MTIKITGKCPQCGGDGLRDLYNGSIPPVLKQVTCASCSGTGIVDVGELDSTKIDDILGKCNDVLDKCNDIFEKVNES